MSEMFLSTINIDLLWSILLENSLVQQNKAIVYKAFISNTKIFYEKEKNNIVSLMNMNKHFLSQMLKLINNEPKLQNGKKTLYKAEDIQSHRQSQFEKQLAQKKMDFENSITVPKPVIPNFSEKIEEDKIQGMEELIAQTVAQRNFEIEQIHTNAYTVNTNKDWLKSQETSIKPNTGTGPLAKNFIKIEEDIQSAYENEEIVDLSKITNKKIRWSNDNQINYYDNTTENTVEVDESSKEYDQSNIVNKLKKIHSVPLEENRNKPKYITKEELVYLKERMDTMDKKLDRLMNLFEKSFDNIARERVL